MPCVLIALLPLPAPPPPSLSLSLSSHVANGAYPSWAYVLAGFVAHLPVAVTECLIFTSIVYFMAGLNAAAGNFFFFFLVVLITDIFFRNLMALFSYLGRTLQAAQAMPLPIIVSV